MAKPAVKKEEEKEVKAVVLKKDAKLELTKEDKMIDEARLYFKELQQSWFRFAKIIWEVRTLAAYKDNHDSFKDYCNAEFPSMEYTTLLKYCLVAENFAAAIEDKIKKDDSYVLPSYHSFYLVAGLKEDTLKKEEISKIRKMVLDAKIGYHSLREKLKEMVAMRVSKTVVAMPIDDIERSLEKDIARDVSGLSDEDIEYMGEEDLYDGPEEEIEDDEEESSGATIQGVQTKVNYLIDNLPDFENELSKKFCAQSDAVGLAESMNKLHKIMDKFLTKFEKLSE